MNPSGARLLSSAALALAAWTVHSPGALAAAPPTPETGADTPRLYTNADLAGLGRPSAPEAAPPSTGSDAEAWEFVQDFLERKRRELEADRRYQLEREAIEGPTGGCEGERTRYVAPFLGVYGTSFLAVPFRFPRLDGPAASPPPPRVASPHGRPFDPRAFMGERPTIHARPPLRGSTRGR